MHINFGDPEDFMPAEGLTNLTIRQEAYERLMKFSERNKLKAGHFVNEIASSLDMKSKPDDVLHAIKLASSLRIGTAIREELFATLYENSLDKLFSLIEEAKAEGDRLQRLLAEAEDLEKKETTDPVGNLVGPKQLERLTLVNELLILTETVTCGLKLALLLQGPFKRLYPRRYDRGFSDRLRDLDTPSFLRKLKYAIRSKAEQGAYSCKEIKEQADSFVETFQRFLDQFKDTDEVQELGNAAKPFLADLSKKIEEYIAFEMKIKETRENESEER